MCSENAGIGTSSHLGSYHECGAHHGTSNLSPEGASPKHRTARCLMREGYAPVLILQLCQGLPASCTVRATHHAALQRLFNHQCTPQRSSVLGRLEFINQGTAAESSQHSKAAIHSKDVTCEAQPLTSHCKNDHAAVTQCKGCCTHTANTCAMLARHRGSQQV